MLCEICFFFLMFFLDIYFISEVIVVVFVVLIGDKLVGGFFCEYLEKI